MKRRIISISKNGTVPPNHIKYAQAGAVALPLAQGVAGATGITLGALSPAVIPLSMIAGPLIMGLTGERHGIQLSEKEKKERDTTMPAVTTAVNIPRRITSIERTSEFPSDIRTYTRPIPVSYEAVAKGDSIDVPGGRAEVEDIDADGRMILGPTVPTPQNPQNKKPEDDKEKDKKNKKFLDTIKKFIYSKGTTTSDKALQSILWETKGNNWGTILGTNKGLRNLVGRGLIMYPNLLPIVLPEAAERVKTGLKETVNGVVDKVFGPDSTTVTTPTTPTTTTPEVSYEDPNDSIKARLDRLRSNKLK